MTFLEKLQVIERVDGLIRRKATGTAKELSYKLGVSRRTVYELIDVMKKMDAPIEYCQFRMTFYYKHDCDLAIGFVPSERINGGFSNNFLNNFKSADFLHNSCFTLYQDRELSCE